MGSFSEGKAIEAWNWPFTASSAEVKMHGAVPPLPQYAFMAWHSDKKHRDNFIQSLHWNLTLFSRHLNWAGWHWHWHRNMLMAVEMHFILRNTSEQHHTHADCARISVYDSGFPTIVKITIGVKNTLVWVQGKINYRLKIFWSHPRYI